MRLQISSTRKNKNFSEWIRVILTVCFLLLQCFEISVAVSRHVKATYLEKNYIHSKENSSSKKICKTPACTSVANEILQHMNKSVDPCHDFYQFSCGNFIKNTQIPDDQTSVTIFKMLTAKIRLQIRNSIEQDISHKDPRTFKMLKSYFEMCMNADEIEKNSNEEFLAIIRKLGDWPVLKGESWNEKNFNWMDTIQQFRLNGFSYHYLIKIAVGVDAIDNSKHVIHLDQPILGLSLGFLRKGFGNKNVKPYFSYMVDLATSLGADQNRAQQEMKEALNFEMQLAKISLSKEKRRNETKLYNKMSLKAVQTKYPYIHWKSFLNDILKPHTSIHEDERIIVAVPSFFRKLGKILKSTPKRVLANYLMWRISDASARFLGKQARTIHAKFVAAQTGKKTRGERWKTCVIDITNDFLVGAAALYVRKHFDRGAKQEAENMIENIRRSFKNILEKTNWIDEKTRKAALEKVEHIISFAAYPDELFDDEKLDNYYKPLEIGDSYLKTNLNLKLFHDEYSLSKLRQPVVKKDWIKHSRSAFVNAFYNPLENSMQVPAGILQGLFFDKDKPKYLNYGAVGHIMGHEITHGFDDHGSQFDRNGNLLDWWEKETKKEYLQRTECIIDQYSNYTDEEVGFKLNGMNTQGENVADNGGLKASFFAYQQWERDNGVEPCLPGLQYTPHQMYWISAANVFCSKFRPEALITRIVSGAHSPGEFRVIGSVSNSPDFSRAFNCPLGSRMNPVEKCTVW